MVIRLIEADNNPANCRAGVGGRPHLLATRNLTSRTKTPYPIGSESRHNCSAMHLPSNDVNYADPCAASPLFACALISSKTTTDTSKADTSTVTHKPSNIN